MSERHDIPDLKDIIDNADAEILRTFLRKQATRNTALALKLRAHLVEEIDNQPGVNKYSQVIGLLVHHNVQGTIHLTKRSLQILRDICEHFVRLMTRHLQEGELRNAWEVAYAVIAHLHMLMDKYQGPDQKLISILSECYTHLVDLLQINPAPELKQSIFTSLCEIANRNHHVIYDIQNNSITCLIQSASDLFEHKYVCDLVVEKLSIPDEEADSQRKIWSALLLKIPEQYIDIKAHMSVRYVYDIAHLLHAAGDATSLSALLRTFTPPEDLTMAQRKQWLKWKFDLALHSGSSTEIYDSGWALLKLDEDMHTYRRLRGGTPGQYLTDGLDTADISDDLRGEIYAEEQQWDEFIALLNRSRSLPMLVRHCKGVVLNADNPEELLHQVAYVYTLHHGGPKSSEQLGMLMETLQSFRYDKLASNVAEQLKRDFPGRFDEVLKVKGRRKGRKHVIEINEISGSD